MAAGPPLKHKETGLKRGLYDTVAPLRRKSLFWVRSDSVSRLTDFSRYSDRIQPLKSPFHSAVTTNPSHPSEVLARSLFLIENQVKLDIIPTIRFTLSGVPL